MHRIALQTVKKKKEKPSCALVYVPCSSECLCTVNCTDTARLCSDPLNEVDFAVNHVRIQVQAPSVKATRVTWYLWGFHHIVVASILLHLKVVFRGVPEAFI